MKNTKHHQSESYIFSRQSYTALEQQIPTPGLVYASQYTTTLPPAGRAYSLPLAADQIGTSREPARPPATPQAVWPTHSTHNRPAQRGLEQGTPCPVFSRTNISRPNTQAHKPTSGYPYTGVTSPHPGNTQTSERTRERPRRGVWQDKGSLSRALEASREPAPLENASRADGSYTNTPRSQNSATTREKLVHTTLWLKPAVRSEFERLAALEHLPLSQVGAAACEQWVRFNIHQKHMALIPPVIEQTISKHMRGISTRLAWLLVRVSIDCGQTRSLVTNILGRQPGMTTDLLGSLVKQSAATARGNITRRTPQLEDVIESLEKWLLTDDKPENENRGEDN